ncbi:hypothetical protein A5844_001845 [Enterococcus sp. 10A9_DIV0425]|uniref:Uncharacterized protein n=1 Tax=Candidatus Enterococcus wittei TaxID=1987383 RepID=A0A242JXU9_9ENTE|nr:hypothetical protein [Enterococcus sp. 10A9_DIV0425]OTP10147.1 hypothetical protein A5844_001845 [Enterococcus sp. 10A9_DIV0425]THE12394.1 hypothetical protein E1H99_07565 [Enterococcus hirae]
MSDETLHEIEISIQGPSAVPFWHDDLKAAAALSLIDTIDMKNFDPEQYEVFENIVGQLNKALKILQNL